MNKKQLVGDLSVLAAAVLWGCIGFFTRNLSDFSPVQIVAARAFITSFLVFLFILVTDPKKLRIKLSDLWIFLGNGIASFLFFNICYMTSIGENSLSVACILMYTSPIWVTLIASVLFHEKLTLRKILSLVICFGGCAAVCLSSSLVLTKRGLVYGLLSGFGYALYSIFGKFAARKYSSLTTTFYTFFIASIGVLPFCHITEMTSNLTNAHNILFMIGIGITNTVLPYIFYTVGLSKIPAGRAAVIAIVEPVVSAITGAVFFSEFLGVSGILGILAVFAGLTILQTAKE